VKKLLLLALLSVSLCFPALSYGQGGGGHGVYIGIGGSYVIENFDVKSENILGTTYDPDFDDTWGVNVKIGNHFTKWFSLEFDYDYLFDFESEKTLNIIGLPVKTELNAQINTYMIVAKFSAGSGMVQPFFVAGGGMMNVEADARASAGGTSASDSDSETDPCAKVGLGLDFFLNDNVSIGIEGTHVWGFNDLDEIKYFSLTSGVGYHF
jgi:opacity protein-like surface antigen